MKRRLSARRVPLFNRQRLVRFLFGAALAYSFVLAWAPAGHAQEDAEFFERKIRPVLVEHCYSCHSADAKKLKADLRVDSRASLLQGGDTGPAIDLKKPDASLLLKAIRYDDVDLRMPPRSKLPETAIADITAWVRKGAPWPDSKSATVSKKDDKLDIAKRKAEHWAWSPVKVGPTPSVKDQAWPADAVDAFLLAKAEEKGLHPVEEADGHTLLRRLHFVITGLPPSKTAIADFLADSSPQAVEKVVDRLLASPAYAERWARHWLDLVRYAESRGHEFDFVIPNAYQYRDYVIRAFQADLPYDQFVLEHIAGDLLPKPRLNQPTKGPAFNESILGTGFWFLGEEIHSPVDIRMDQADRFDNRIDVFSKTFLGLTVSCARCHDHKFDAISARDYYALFGFLQSSSYRQARFDTMYEHAQIAAQREKVYARIREQFWKSLYDGVDLSSFRRYGRALAEPHRGKIATKIESVARQHSLDAERLGRWNDELILASKTADHPLHMLAQVIIPGKALTPPPEKASADALVVADYTRPGTPWISDGPGFGDRPARPGDVRFTGKDEPRVIELGAAEYDRGWDKLALAIGWQGESGGGGSLLRPGKMVRSPNFQLAKKRLYYLVKGKGQAYAAVSQHVLLHGPLHGSLVARFDTQGKYQWVGHDLTPYLGLKGHVEFTPADGADLSIAKVIQADEPPGAFQFPPVVPTRSLNSVESSLEAFAVALALSPRQLARIEKESNESTISSARLGRWLAEHADLFDSKGAGFDLAKASAAARSELAAVSPAEVMTTPSRLAPAIIDGTAQDENVFVRGSPKVLGDLAPRRFLEALSAVPMNAQGSARLDLARVVVNPQQNPLVARVIVNRIWSHVFGRGIVASTDNFGVLGERPSHPELLDRLADDFVKDGWSIRRLVRRLVLTKAFAQASSSTAEQAERDPDNLLLTHARVRRLEGEAIRDSMLAVSGRLNPAMYGPSVATHLTDFQQGRGRPNSGPLDGDGRRSIYLGVKRNFLSSFLLAFDTPAPFSTVGRRTVSNVPAQSLILMNDPFVHEQAKRWGERVATTKGTTSKRVGQMYLDAFGRPASPAELRECVDYLTNGGQETVTAERWIDLAHSLFNAKEFIFVP